MINWSNKVNRSQYTQWKNKRVVKFPKYVSMYWFRTQLQKRSTQTVICYLIFFSPNKSFLKLNKSWKQYLIWDFEAFLLIHQQILMMGVHANIWGDKMFNTPHMTFPPLILSPAIYIHGYEVKWTEVKVSQSCPALCYPMD